MDKVKKLIEAGASARIAIREALGMTASAFAEKHGLNSSIVSSVFTGERRASDAILDALVSEIGGTPDEWRMLLWEAARPDVTTEEPSRPAVEEEVA